MDGSSFEAEAKLGSQLTRLILGDSEERVILRVTTALYTAAYLVGAMMKEIDGSTAVRDLCVKTLADGVRAGRAEAARFQAQLEGLRDQAPNQS